MREHEVMAMAKSKTKIVRQLRHGQITIPKEFRDELGLEPDDLLQVKLADGKLEVSTVRTSAKRGSEWAVRLYEEFAPVREALKGMSEQEIDDMIREALDEVRAEQPNTER
jgi:AbrB family looped-hinge helix DNA binding protein